MILVSLCFYFFFFKQKTAYEMRISDWSSDVCSSDLTAHGRPGQSAGPPKRLFAVRCLWRSVPSEDSNSGAVAATARRKRQGTGQPEPSDEIGRASCRERVCQYV